MWPRGRREQRRWGCCAYVRQWRRTRRAREQACCSCDAPRPTSAAVLCTTAPPHLHRAAFTDASPACGCCPCTELTPSSPFPPALSLSPAQPPAQVSPSLPLSLSLFLLHASEITWALNFAPSACSEVWVSSALGFLPSFLTGLGYWSR